MHGTISLNYVLPVFIFLRKKLSKCLIYNHFQDHLVRVQALYESTYIVGNNSSMQFASMIYDKKILFIKLKISNGLYFKTVLRPPSKSPEQNSFSLKVDRLI